MPSGEHSPNEEQLCTLFDDEMMIDGRGIIVRMDVNQEIFQISCANEEDYTFEDKVCLPRHFNGTTESSPRPGHSNTCFDGFDMHDKMANQASKDKIS